VRRSRAADPAAADSFFSNQRLKFPKLEPQSRAGFGPPACGSQEVCATFCFIEVF
jgi:hypothetical protein